MRRLRGRRTRKFENTKTVSICLPVELLEWIDGYTRIAAIDGSMRVTRNMTIVGFLSQVRERQQFNGGHIEEIEKVIALARSQQPGNVE